MRTKAICVQLREGESRARLWRAPRVWSSERVDLRLVPAELALEELALQADRVLGANYKTKTIAVGPVKTVVAHV